jgi:hypothetical protein
MGSRPFLLQVNRVEEAGGFLTAATGNFYGADAVAGEVGHADAEKVGALDGDTNLLCWLSRLHDETVERDSGVVRVMPG